MRRVLPIVLSLSLVVSGLGFVPTAKMVPDASAAVAGKLSDASQGEILESLDEGNIIDEVSGNAWKSEANANPISPSIFCADPTCVEYNGRLYVYGTNDHQQYQEDTKNDYDQIRSLVVFSTDDMVNWIYHGRIEVGEIAPWIANSWAPSITSRVEEDGLTHFYLYFANSGQGVGVITSTDPVEGWSDPLGKPLVYQNMPGLKNCPAPFDPGVVIDDNGVGWLAFGGGTTNESPIHSKVPKVVRLGKDMLSFDSEFVSIDAPYFCEASELNYIDGTFYYTYCNDWQDRGKEWDYDGIAKPPKCSMAYLTTKTPLDADSWKYQGAYFYNSGENSTGNSGMTWGNNHTHFAKYQGVNYIIHHTMMLEDDAHISGGFRSLMVDYLPMDPANLSIPITAASRKGVKQIKAVDAYTEQRGSLMLTSADVFYDKVANPAAKSMAPGAWTMVKCADFAYGADQFVANVKGKGRVEVRLDNVQSEPVAYIEFDNSDFAKVASKTVKKFDGRNHNVFFVFSGADIEFDSWYFTKSEKVARPAEDIGVTDVTATDVTIQGQTANGAMNSTLEVVRSGDYVMKTAPIAEKDEVLNLGFVNYDENATYDIYVKSLTLHTADGDVEIPVGQKLNPKSRDGNGLANGWGGATIGSCVYGTEECGLFAETASVDWINYRFALKINGEEVPYTSIDYNVTITVAQSEKPTPIPTEVPTEVPTKAPAETTAPVQTPVVVPTEVPTKAPAETTAPVQKPVVVPTEAPVAEPQPEASAQSAFDLKKPAITKLTKRKKSFKIRWAKVKNASGYELQYSTSSKFTKKTTKTVKVKGNTKFAKTVKKLKAKKKYYVRVRAYKDGKAVTVYTKWSKAKAVKTK